MDINIESLAGISFILVSFTFVLFSVNFVVSVDNSATILDLKKKIKETQGIDPERQTLYYKGYLINDDEVALTDLGGNTLSLVLPTAGDVKEIRSDRQLTLVIGSKQDFGTLSMARNQTSRYKLSSKQFGIVHNTEGSEVGKRVYRVEVFKVKKEGFIDIKTAENDDTVSYTVTLLSEENLDEPGTELKGVIEIYDEAKQRP